MAVTVNEYIPGVNEKPRVDIASDKFNHVFTVEPAAGGFVFYRITVNKGNLPKELQGNYSRMKDAVEAVKRYERLAKPSKTVDRDRKAAARDKRKAEAEV